MLVGAQDSVTPPELSAELARGILGAELHQLAGAGHLSNVERPGDFNAAVEAFMDQVESRA